MSKEIVAQGEVALEQYYSIFTKSHEEDSLKYFSNECQGCIGEKRPDEYDCKASACPTYDAFKALEKQIPKTPRMSSGKHITNFKCSCCGFPVGASSDGTYFSKLNYCGACGQKQKWEE